MTLLALAGKFGLLQAGILAVVITGAGFWLASGNLIGDLGNLPVAQQLEQSVFRTKGQSADAQEATAEIGATLVEMSGGPAQEAIPRGAAYPPPATADEPAPPDNRQHSEDAPIWANFASSGENTPANPGADATDTRQFTSDQREGSKGYAVDQAANALTPRQPPTVNQQRIKALRGEWDDRYQRVGQENAVLLRDIAKTREYKNDYFELQEERVQKLNLSARNGPAIREAMLGTIARQRAAFGKWDAAAADVESRIYEIMGELDNVNELMQFLEDGAVFDRIVNESPEIGVRTLLLHQDIQRLENASLELADTLSLADAG